MECTYVMQQARLDDSVCSCYFLHRCRHPHAETPKNRPEIISWYCMSTSLVHWYVVSRYIKMDMTTQTFSTF